VPVDDSLANQPEAKQCVRQCVGGRDRRGVQGLIDQAVVYKRLYLDDIVIGGPKGNSWFGPLGLSEHVSKVFGKCIAVKSANETPQLGFLTRERRQRPIRAAF
jgi:hypothetical protein